MKERFASVAFSAVLAFLSRTGSGRRNMPGNTTIMAGTAIVTTARNIGR